MIDLSKYQSYQSTWMKFVDVLRHELAQDD